MLVARLFEAFQAVQRFVEDYITQRFYVSMEITKKEHQVYSRIMEYVTEKQMGDIHKKLRRVQCVAKVDQANPLAAQNYGGSVEKPPHPELSMRPSKFVLEQDGSWPFKFLIYVCSRVWRDSRYRVQGL